MKERKKKEGKKERKKDRQTERRKEHSVLDNAYDIQPKKVSGCENAIVDNFMAYINNHIIFSTIFFSPSSAIHNFCSLLVGER